MPSPAVVEFPDNTVHSVCTLDSPPSFPSPPTWAVFDDDNGPGSSSALFTLVPAADGLSCDFITIMGAHDGASTFTVHGVDSTGETQSAIGHIRIGGGTMTFTFGPFLPRP